MIKRIRFATRRSGVGDAAFAAAWHDSLAAGALAPPPARPVRAALGVARPEVVPDPRHDAVGVEWFRDTVHLERFEQWLETSGGAAAGGRREEVSDPAATLVLVAEEVVLRGADWLARRWEDATPKPKHIALARRAPGLTPAAFSEAWKAHAGALGRPGATRGVAIPAGVRGCAYVQDHVQRGAEGGYDAVNEVWFDDVEALRARVAWFDAQDAGNLDDDLFGAHWFLAVEETVVVPTQHPPGARGAG